MSREVRRVPVNWEHPRSESGHYIPLFRSLPYNEKQTKEGLRDGWLKDEPPNYGCNVMPQWPDSERTHYQMYEIVTDGTPISPVMETPEALAHWLADNKTPAGPHATATYDQWLAMIEADSTTCSFVFDRTTGETISGVEDVSRR